MMSLFSNIFPSKAVDFSVQVDMHSHLLPGIDDGAKTVEDSLEMIAGLQNMGYKHFICTPHIMGDYYKNTKETIQKSFDLLQDNLIKFNSDAKISFAAEYYMDESFTQKVMRKEKLLCLFQNYLLVETSYINKPSNLRDLIFELQMSGYQIVLAHPERYTYMYKSFELYQELHDLGVFFQLNLNSLCGHYSPAARKIGQQLIDAKMVEFVGTDCHTIRHIEVLKKSLAEKYTHKLATLNLLNNQLV